MTNVAAASRNRGALWWVAALTLLTAPAALAQTAVPVETRPLSLRWSLFGMKYSLDEEQPKRVFGLLGLSADFKETLGAWPVALSEAKSSHVWSGLQLAGLLGVTAMATKTFFDALSDARTIGDIDDRRDPRLVGIGGTSVSDLAVLSAFGSVAIIGGLRARGHLKRSICLYNAAERLSATGSAPYGDEVQAACDPVNRVNVRFGFNRATVSTVGDGPDAGSRTGITVGLSLDRSLGSAVGIRPELLLSIEGARTEGDAAFEGSPATDLRHTMLRVPVLLRFLSGIPHVLIGPSLGVRLSSSVRVGDQSGSADGYRTVELGGVLAAGVRLRSGLSIELRHHRALTALHEVSGEKGRVSSLLFGFAF